VTVPAPSPTSGPSSAAILNIPAVAARRRSGEAVAETVGRLAAELDVARRDLAVARGWVDDLAGQNDRLAWNLAGCTALAESRSMANANFDESHAGPALRAVRDLLRDHVARSGKRDQ
jgi:hypothetical protein